MHLHRAQLLKPTGQYGKPSRAIPCLRRAVIIPAPGQHPGQNTRSGVMNMIPSTLAVPFKLGVLCRASPSGTVMDVQPNNSSASLLRVHYLRKDASYKVCGASPCSERVCLHYVVFSYQLVVEYSLLARGFLSLNKSSSSTTEHTASSLRNIPAVRLVSFTENLNSHEYCRISKIEQ